MTLGRRFFSLSPALGLIVAIAGMIGPAAPVAAAQPASGYLLLDGAAAATFQIPTDVRLVSTWREPQSGLIVERYQQFAAPRSVYVDGAQLSVVRRGERQVLVTGVHYAGLRTNLRAALASGAAIDRAAVDRSVPDALGADPDVVVQRAAELRLDPDSGRLLYVVESRGFAVHTFHKIDAQTGRVLEAWDAIDRVNGMGTGVKGDRKDIVDLTSQASGVWQMKSPGPDHRFVTWDALHNWGPSGWIVANDNTKTAWANDNDWQAPAQAAAVDAQYYAALTVDFYSSQFGYQLVGDCLTQLQSVVHRGSGYSNAFWDGTFMVYGDGDGFYTRGFSAGQDVVTHELSHAVTTCASDLEYQNESGALNEAFSDIMATAAEWDFAEPLNSNCRLAPGQTECADWLLGEDIIIDPTWLAFRDLADPAAQGQPSHYAQRQIGGGDSGGVHTNSGIANHAFYLMVHGGRNARCSGPNDPTADCDVMVPPISMADAQRIIFMAWGAPLLSETAGFCAARDATVEAAKALFPSSTAHRAAAELAWAAVGVNGCAPPTDFLISLPNRSIALAPDGSGQLNIQLTHFVGHTTPVTFDVSDPSPTATAQATNQVAPSEDGTLTISVPPGSSSALVPLVVSATDGAETHYASATLIIDADAPVATIDSVGLPSSGQVTTGGTVPLTVDWSATDIGSGIASSNAQYSANGTDWVALPPELGAGTHRFRAQATDGVGYSATSGAALRNLSAYQEISATFAGNWLTNSSATAWGTTRFSKARGASATFNFNGTDVVWVAQRGPKRGVAKVYLDGALTKVNLYANSLSERRIVFSAAALSAGPHTLRIVVKGKAGRPRVDVDGFLVLGP